MVRLAVRGFALSVVAPVLAMGLVACSHPSAPAKAARRDASRQFANEEAKILACLDLRDHIVALYADEYVHEQGLEMTQAERTAFRDGWAEELAKKGTFERFESSCFYSLTPRKYQCGMASQTTDGLVACMKLSSL